MPSYYIQRFVTDLKFDSIARLRIRPRMLKGITSVDVSILFLGKKFSMPILLQQPCKGWLIMWARGEQLEVSSLDVC